MKVSCLWMMAGNWENDGVGTENNFARAPRSRKASAYLLALENDFAKAGYEEKLAVWLK